MKPMFYIKLPGPAITVFQPVSPLRNLKILNLRQERFKRNLIHFNIIILSLSLSICLSLLSVHGNYNVYPVSLKRRRFWYVVCSELTVSASLWCFDAGNFHSWLDLVPFRASFLRFV